jgi:NADH:ubiquinone oxidoreductase subunit 6 (subunit J)
MYILLALIGACALGIAAHFLIPDRQLRGVALVPAIATAVSAITYTGLQWAGVGEESIWLWLASVLGAAVIAGLAALALTVLRKRSDAEARVALGI